MPNRAKKKSLISFLSTGRVTPIFVYIEYVLLPTTGFINYLSQKLLQYINSPIIMCFKKLFQLLSLMAAGHRCVLRHNVCQPLHAVVCHFLKSISTLICEDILMRCAANSIFDCAGVRAGGFAEPSRYGVVCNFLHLISAVICEDILMRCAANSFLIAHVFGREDSQNRPVTYVVCHFLHLISDVICDDNLMRNG